MGAERPAKGINCKSGTAEERRTAEEATEEAGRLAFEELDP
jgi:hypothetical protein